MRSRVLAGIIGALRAWTVAMISALSMPQLAGDDVERDPLVREFDGVGVAELVGGETPPHAGLRGDAAQLGAG
jgi:hypothetical protein